MLFYICERSWCLYHPYHYKPAKTTRQHPQGQAGHTKIVPHATRTAGGTGEGGGTLIPGDGSGRVL